jgi:N6-adenosine-specific RNA methylase IME4
MQNHQYANLFPMMSEDEMAALIKDMQDNGYDSTSPITTYQSMILDGRNRYRAAAEASVKPVFVEYAGDDPLAFVLSHNLHRRHLNETQRAGVAAKIANMTGGERTDLQPSPNSDEVKVSRKQAAEMLNVGKSTVATYRAVAAAMPELVEKMDSGEMTANKAWTEVRRKNVKRDLQDVGKQKVKALKGVYDVIVIDPPWPIEKIERDVAPNQVAFEYPTMTVGEIADLKIPCADNCHILLWTTQKFLPSAFELLTAWDLKYVLTFVWHKNGGFQPFGLPQYNCEFALYARRGTPQFVDFKDFMTCFNAKRGSHSEKPEEFYDTLRRVTAGRRLDMFNRRAIEGFDGWGNEAK